MLPVLLGAAVADLGIDEAQVGLLGSGIMGGSAVASLIATVLVHRASWTALCGVALVVQVLGQFGAAQFEYGAVLWCCILLASLGGGAAYAFALTVLSASANSARLFGYSVTSQVAFQVLGMIALPWFAAPGGFAWCLYVLAGLGVVGLVLAQWLPRQTVSAPAGRSVAAGPVTAAAMLALMGCLFFFANVGSFWSYVERIGAAAGFDAGALGSALAVGVAFGMAGALLAAWQGVRWGYAAPLVAAAVLTLASLLLTTESAKLGVFVVGLALYNFAWNYSLAYQYDVVSKVDGSGRLLAATPAFHGVGAAIGPALVAALVLDVGLILVNITAAVCVAASLAMLLPAARR